jgi:two-component system, OmpR family, KDP operon response regulator KdpE
LTGLATILLIEHDLATIKDIQPVLVQEGYSVEHVLPGPLALRATLSQKPDLVILGLQPQESEWQFCRRLLSVLDCPLFLLLSNGHELDRVKGLDLGANDCMAKPVLLIELVARVRALLRRNASSSSWRQRSYFKDGDLIVDLTRRQVQISDKPVALTAMEFRILSCLVSHAGEAVSHEQLLAQVWGPEHGGSHNVLKQHIHHLRRKLEPDPNHPLRIVTQRGEGYMLRRSAAAA